MKLKVTNCARCQQDHEIEYFKFSKNGIRDCDYWGMCPNLNEPVIMKIVEENKDIRERARISYILSAYLCPFDGKEKVTEEEYKQALEDMKKYE
jgi:hypothetical protein